MARSGTQTWCRTSACVGIGAASACELQTGAATGDSRDAEEGLVALEAFLRVPRTNGVVKCGSAKPFRIAGDCTAVVLATQVLARTIFGTACVFFELISRDTLGKRRFAFLLRRTTLPNSQTGTGKTTAGCQTQQQGSKQKTARGAKSGHRRGKRGFWFTHTPS